MIRSMTAFARETLRGEIGELTWELRTVNHRFLEPHLRLPEELRGLETAVRARLSAQLSRGKVDCSLRYSAPLGSNRALQIDRGYVAQLLAAAAELGDLIGRPPTPDPFELLRWPGVLADQGQDLDALGQAALALLDRALASLLANREREGERLAAVLLERCAALQEGVGQVRERLPQVLDGVRRRLSQRLEELRAELDATRLEQELALLATKLDVDEEIERLAAHVQEVKEVLVRGGPVGRRLDFLMQELNREANTLGAKSADVAVTRQAVEMKVLIEQMREQVQNLE